MVCLTILEVGGAEDEAIEAALAPLEELALLAAVCFSFGPAMDSKEMKDVVGWWAVVNGGDWTDAVAVACLLLEVKSFSESGTLSLRRLECMTIVSAYNIKALRERIRKKLVKLKRRESSSQ